MSVRLSSTNLNRVEFRIHRISNHSRNRVSENHWKLGYSERRIHEWFEEPNNSKHRLFKKAQTSSYSNYRLFENAKNRAVLNIDYSKKIWSIHGSTVYHAFRLTINAVFSVFSTLLQHLFHPSYLSVASSLFMWEFRFLILIHNRQDRYAYVW